MIKARVSKNLKGAIMLPTIGPKALIANDVVYCTEEQLFSADIQGALAKKLLIMLEGPSQNEVKFSKITNLSFGSVSLPGANAVLRAGKSIDIRSDLIDTPVYRKMIRDGLIAIDIKFKTGAKEIKDVADADIKPKKGGKKAKAVEPNEEDVVIPANMQIGRPITAAQGVDKNGRAIVEMKRGDNTVRKAPAKKGTPDKKNKHAVRKAHNDDLLLDLNAPDVEEEAEDFLLDPRTGKKVAQNEGIIFVDQEQSQQRMNSKLKGKGKK